MMPGEERVREFYSCLAELIFEVRDVPYPRYIFPDSHFRWYAPLSPTSRIRNGPSQFDKNLSFVFLALLRILQTRSLLWKLLGQTFVLYLLAAWSLHVALRILLLSRSSLRRSSLTARLSLLRDKSNSCCMMDSSPTSTSIMASVPYVRLYGVSCVVVCGVHQYAHRTSSSSFVHLPFAVSNLFFNSFRRTLLAASAWPFVCGCSTELVMDLMSRSA